MNISILNKWKALLVLIIYGLSAFSAGIVTAKVQLSLTKVKVPDAAPVMALVQEPVPLKQTPVIKDIDLNAQIEAPAFNVEVVKEQIDAAPLGRILIYHTHTYEAYRQVPDQLYKETEKWRTRDEAHNVVRVGEELASLLRAKGYQVVHDKGAYEPPVLSSAYTRSLQMLEERVRKGEVYDLYIDLHRDAYSASMANHNIVLNGDQELARIMLLIGKGTGQSYSVKPEWEKNLVLAEQITTNLNEQIDGLCRKINLKTGRFNQHIAPRCVLVEAGNNENTLEQVLHAMPYLADAIHFALKGE